MSPPVPGAPVRPPRGFLATTAFIVIVALGYVAAERVRLLLPVTEGPVWMWLPAGVAVAGLILGGVRVWPGVTLGALITAVVFEGHTVASVFFATEATVEALVFLGLLRWMAPDFDASLSHARDVMVALVAALAASAVGASLGVPVMAAAGGVAPDGLREAWASFWLGDLAGIVIGAPVLIVWLGSPAWAGVRDRGGEFILLLLTVAAVTLPLFGHSLWPLQATVPIGFLTFPLMVWSAFRFGQAGVTAATGLLALVGLAGISSGSLLMAATAPGSASLLAAFITVVAVTAMTLAALVEERTRAQAARRESEEQFGAFMQHMPAVAFIKDADGRYVYGNDEWAAQFGRPKEELLGTTDADLWPDETAVRFRESDRAVLEQGSRVELTESGTDPDGSPHVWTTFKFPIARTDGAPLIGGIAVDISARARIEEALRESEQRYRSLIAAAGSLIVALDAEGRITEWNREAAQFFGVDHEAALGREFVSLCVPESERDAVRAALARTAAGEPVHGQELRIPGAGPRGRTLLWNATGFDANGSSRGASTLVVGQDITPLKELQAQLLAAQRMEGIGRLAGGIAHDFNNLLTAILGHAEMARGDVKHGDPVQTSLKEIQRAGQRAAELTRQLLAFARRQIIEPKVTDLNALVTNVERMLRRLLGEDVELVTKLSPRLARVRVDPGQFEQVLVNLAVNARDAMPGGGRLSIETANVELDEEFARQHPTVKPGPHVRLAVSDTGVGMPPDVLAHAFEPFFTTKEVGKGTGLGLATCYGIVKQAEGSIWIESQPGGGTTFRIYLPKVDAPAEVETPAEPVREAMGGRETVLLAEDEPLVRSLIASGLRLQGYTVLVASNGRDALQQAESAGCSIDALVTDVVMPQMGGLELAERLRATHPGVKVLFISGYADSAVIPQGGLRPGSTLLQKPFTPAHLLRRLRDLLTGERPFL